MRERLRIWVFRTACALVCWVLRWFYIGTVIRFIHGRDFITFQGRIIGLKVVHEDDDPGEPAYLQVICMSDGYRADTRRIALSLLEYENGALVWRDQ